MWFSFGSIHTQIYWTSHLFVKFWKQILSGNIGRCSMYIISAHTNLTFRKQYYLYLEHCSNILFSCVAGIGIDDLFIMSAEWHRTNPEHSPARRIADTLSEAAVAITITSLTDIVSITRVAKKCNDRYWGLTEGPRKREQWSIVIRWSKRTHTWKGITVPLNVVELPHREWSKRSEAS